MMWYRMVAMVGLTLCGLVAFGQYDALFDAAYRCDVAAARALLEGDAPPSAASATMALRVAIKDRDDAQEVARLLVTHGADVATPFPGGGSWLHRAAEYRRSALLVRAMLEHGAKVDALDAQRRTPLHWAAERNFVEVASVLIEFGAPLSLADDQGRTPLGMAIQWNAYDVAAVLARARPAQADLDACFSRAVNTRGVPLTLLRTMLESGASPTGLRAAWGGFAEDWKQAAERLLLLLEFIPDLTAPGSLSPSEALSIACNEAVDEPTQMAILKKLVAAGPDMTKLPDAPRYLIQALSSDRPQVFQQMVALGIDVNARMGDGLYPLMLANAKGIAPLVAAGARIDGPADARPDGPRPYLPLLAWWLTRGDQLPDEAMLSAILAAKPDLTYRDARGRTYLHLVTEMRAPVRGADPAVAILRRLIEAGVPVDGCDREGMTALAAMVSRRNLVRAEALLRCGASPHGAENAISPLYCALERGYDRDSAMVELLLKHGADPNFAMRDPNGRLLLPLGLAARMGNVAGVRALLAGGARVNGADADGRTALHRACATTDARDQGDTCIQLLLDNGADVNATDVAGCAPLHCCVSASRARLLLQAGADVNKAAANGDRPLHACLANGVRNIAPILLDAGADAGVPGADGRTPLMLAAQKGDLPLAIALLERRVDVNAVDAHGATALASAFTARLTHDNVPLIRLLLERGADVNIADENGDTILLKMVTMTAHWRTKHIDLALNAGASVNTANRKGVTPLLAAIQARQSLEAIGRLLDYDADADHADAMGITPLHAAARWHDPETRGVAGRKDLMQMLVSNAAPVNARDAAGETPLFAAMRSHNCNFSVRPLIEFGADMRIRNACGRTLLHEAAASADSTWPLTLIPLQGEDPNARDADGRTPLHVLAVARDGDSTASLNGGEVYSVSGAITALTRAGADINARDKEGLTPLGAALKANHRQMADALRAAGGVE